MWGFWPPLKHFTMLLDEQAKLIGGIPWDPCLGKHREDKALRTKIRFMAGMIALAVVLRIPTSAVPVVFSFDQWTASVRLSGVSWFFELLGTGKMFK